MRLTEVIGFWEKFTWTSIHASLIYGLINIHASSISSLIFKKLEDKTMDIRIAWKLGFGFNAKPHDVY